MKINKLVFSIILAYVLVGCMNKEKALEGDLIQKDNMIDNKKFIEESKKRSENNSKYGPNMEDTINNDLREHTRTQIDKEEAPNYDSLSDSGAGNIFTVDLNVENMDIRTFTHMMSTMTGVNFLVSDEVNGMVTAQLKDVSWPNALDSVLSLKGWAKHVDNKANIIRIHSQDNIVKIENFERQRKTDLQKTAMLEKAESPMYTEAFKLFYTKPDDVKKILESVLGASAAASTDNSVRNTSPQITIDPRVNQLIIKAREDDIGIAKKVIEKVDTRTKQVFIEAFIVEVSDDFEKALGTQLGANFAGNTKDTKFGHKTYNIRVTGEAGDAADSVSPGTTDAALTNFAAAGATSGISTLFGLGDTADLKLALTALESKSVSKIISNPRIFTLDNQEAIIFQGTEIPYETTSSNGTQVQFKQAGLKLTVTPSVVGDGNLKMVINLNKDSADTSQDNPPITQSQISTNLVTKDGSIVVIGGIYTQDKSDSSDKVPLLGDVPVAGKLFRRDTRGDNRKELMIFIAPKII